MELINFSTLFNRDGSYNLPVLIELKHPNKASWYFTNNDQDIKYGSNLYKSTLMSFIFPGSRDGVPVGGEFEIDVDVQTDSGDELLKWFDEATHETSIDITGLINDAGEIRQIARLSQRHGNVTWNGEKITWSLGEDERMNMQSNPWIFDFESLTG